MIIIDTNCVPLENKKNKQLIISILIKIQNE